MDTFTVNRAAQLLERDRRTLTKALRNVPPDATVRGQSQYRLATIIAATDRLPSATKAASHGNRNRLSDYDFCAQQFAVSEAFTRASDALVALGEMPKRLRKPQAKDVFAKIDALRVAFEKTEPDGLSNESRSVLQQMFGGLLFELDLQLDPNEFPDEDD